MNSYIKCFTGRALGRLRLRDCRQYRRGDGHRVYQLAGIDMEKITFAVSNIIADLSGIICDGAKTGCSMKIVTGADTAMRSAFMALAGYGISTDDGIIGGSAEESIRNLSRISFEGMGLVDSTVVHISSRKIASPGPGLKRRDMRSQG